MGCGQAKNSRAATPEPRENISPTVSGAAAQSKKKPSQPETRPSTSVEVGQKKSSNDKSSVWLVMGKYRMNTGKEDMMGEGASSICRKATGVDNGEQVAVKVYKTGKDNSLKAEEVKLQKFKRQITVLKELQEPFDVPEDKDLWTEQLARAKPSRLFMQLVDYSKNSKGEPGPDPSDGVLYVVTELAQYSLKDYLALRRDQGKSLCKDSVRNITKAVVLVMAGLHAKGLVHIDMKPENLMMFNGRLKLIDVDGCVKTGTSVSIQDSSISFSPCYCAPEWAKFLIQSSESRIKVSPCLDVWSVGMTLCELVTLDAVFKPMYANFLRNGHSHREAGFLFMDWLSSITKAPLPKSIEKFDPDFVDLLHNCLLVCDHTKRKTLAQSLQNPYISSLATGDSRSSRSAPQGTAPTESVRVSSGLGEKDEENAVVVDELVVRSVRNRREDLSSTAPLHKGTLWKLNLNGDPKEAAHWLKRDMWVSSNGSLCYFSIKENKRLVMIDGAKLPAAKISRFQGGVKNCAFQVATENDDGEADLVSVFAAESENEYDEWVAKLKSAVNMDEMMQSMRLGANMAQELQRFKVNVINRRMKVDKDKEDQFAPLFKGKLWKVKAEGDRRKEEDWFLREMWIAKNGSLVYFSKKEDRELVYYNTDDVARASFVDIPNADTFRPWAFQVALPPSNDVEFAPGEFAAESEEMRATWIAEFKKVQ